MSDALLTEISKKLSDIHAALIKGGAAPVAAPKTTTTTAAPDAAAKAKAEAAAKAKADAEAKAKADAAAKAKAAAAAAAPKGPAAGTKAPGGKFTIDQVRDLIRQVATNASLGKQSAADILSDDGGGVTKVTDLKPENYDKVAEACQVLLNGEGAGAPAAAPEDDLM